MPGRTGRVAAAVLAAAVLPTGAALSGCDGGSHSHSAGAAGAGAASPAASSSPAASASAGMAGMPGMTGSGTGAGATNAASSEDGAALGVRMQSLLGQHTVLASDMMRARVRRDPDFAQAAEVALTRNTQALSSLVATVLGSDAGQKFSDLWAQHLTQLYAYADAAAGGSGQAAAKAQARRQLATLEQQLGALLVAGSHGRLDADAARQQITMHVDGLLAQTDAYAAKDYVRADAAYDEDFQHGFAMGGAAAAALLPKADAAALGTPSWQLRSGLTQLLGEHVALVVASMRAATSDSRDFDALGGALNRNTAALAGALDTLFGADAARGFQSLWADHVDALLDATQATAKHDSAALASARQRLHAFEPALASFLSGALGSRLGADALARAFAMHDAMLVDEATAYQAKDYTRAHDLGYQAYDQMYVLSAQLSHGIQLTLGAKLPKGGSQTGGGGMSAVVARR
jgi:hypothetical protein